LIEGEATKERIKLIRGCFVQISDFRESKAELKEMIGQVAIELINSLSCANYKTRTLSEGILKDLAALLNSQNSLEYLFQVLLAGLAGYTSQTHACTLKALNLLVKEQKAFFQEAGVQNFLLQTSKITIIMLQSEQTPVEVKQQCFKFLKLSVNLLDSLDTIKHELIVALVGKDKKRHAKFMLLMRQVLSKVIRKIGEAEVRKWVPEEHQKLITYIERMRRKKDSKEKRERMKMLLGEDDKESEDESDSENEETDSDDEEVKYEDDML